VRSTPSCACEGTLTRGSVILKLHRAWCEFATREFASDPLSSRYGVSVIACYRSASAILAVSCEAYEVMPHPMTRLSCIFYQAFTAAVSEHPSRPCVLSLRRSSGHSSFHCYSLPFSSFRKGCLAERKPQNCLLHISSSSWAFQLNRTDGIAQRLLQSLQPVTLLTTLTELRDNARASQDRYLSGESTDFSTPGSARIQDIMDCVSGRTRCVAGTHEDVTLQDAPLTTLDPLQLPPDASDIFGTLDELAGVHPSVLEYLQTLEMMV
jgi:hypothetical protein